jgi:hypothetical protein
MDAQARRRLNMSDNRGAFECECREPGVYGSFPNRECPHCDGTGYTNDPARKKDWIKNPPPDMDW